MSRDNDDARGDTPLSYLPPPTREALVRETFRLVGGCVAGIVLLGIVVYFLTA
jgi:hypothetical protein